MPSTNTTTTDFDVVLLQKEDNFFWGVYEYASEQIVHKTPFEEDARNHVKFLRRGGAFAGFTPSFILIDFPVVTEG